MTRHSTIKPVKSRSAHLLRKFFTRHVRVEARLAAPASEVWRWFTDFESFPNWNPFIRKAQGPLRVGARLSLRLRLGERVLEVCPVVTALEPAREVRWKTHVVMPGLFDVDRRFVLDSTSSQGTLFVQEETNSGLLVPLAYALADVEQQLRTGFRDFSQALALQMASRKRASGAGAPESAGADTPNHAIQN
jgi:hypothetical protein